MSLAKANSLMRGLREKLVLRLPSTYIFSDSVDAAGAPVLTVADGAWHTGDQYFILRIRPIAQLGVNSLGLAQESFCPTDVQIVSEATAHGSGLSFLSDAVMQALCFEVFRLGTAVEFYLSGDTEQPVLADLSDVTKFQRRLDDLINPMLITV